jgi:hypothetical protein
MVNNWRELHTANRRLTELRAHSPKGPEYLLLERVL